MLKCDSHIHSHFARKDFPLLSRMTRLGWSEILCKCSMPEQLGAVNLLKMQRSLRSLMLIYAIHKYKDASRPPSFLPHSDSHGCSCDINLQSTKRCELDSPPNALSRCCFALFVYTLLVLLVLRNPFQSPSISRPLHSTNPSALSQFGFPLGLPP